LDETHQAAFNRSQAVPNSVFIPPFDHPDIWEGNSTIIDEIKADLKEKPTAIVCSVGGGGLLNGIALGLERCILFFFKKKKQSISKYFTKYLIVFFNQK